MSLTWIVVILTVAMALIFDAINGFHDSANSIATVVSTRVLSPRNAVIWAAFFNFIAMFIFVPRVADTVSKIVRIQAGDPAFVYVVLAGLVGAIVWDVLTWWLGLPTSSSHALIGGFAGAGIAFQGTGVIRWEKIWATVRFIPLSPLIGMALGFVIMIAVYWLFRRWRPYDVDKLFRKGQLVSAALYSLGHGGNDAQKTMGIILPLLFSIGYFGASVDPNNLPMPLWVILASYAAIALGTLSGGWRIVKTMGYKITKLRPVHGFAAETAGASTIIGASLLGIPVSTTHIICTSIMGVGTTMGTSTVKWGVARTIMWAWILTIPVSALIGYVTFAVIRVIIGY